MPAVKLAAKPSAMLLRTTSRRIAVRDVHRRAVGLHHAYARRHLADGLPVGPPQHQRLVDEGRRGEHERSDQERRQEREHAAFGVDVDPDGAERQEQDAGDQKDHEAVEDGRDRPPPPLGQDEGVVPAGRPGRIQPSRERSRRHRAVAVARRPGPAERVGPHRPVLVGAAVLVHGAQGTCRSGSSPSSPRTSASPRASSRRARTSADSMNKVAKVTWTLTMPSSDQ